MNFSSQLMLEASLSLLTFTSSGVNNSRLCFCSSPGLSKPATPENTSLCLSARFDCYFDEVSKNSKAAFAALRMPCTESTTLLAFEQRRQNRISTNPA